MRKVIFEGQAFQDFVAPKAWLEESYMTHPLALELPENVYELLLEKARQAGISPEALAVQLLSAATQTVIDDPLEQFIGAFSRYDADWADAHDKYLGLSVKEKMHREEREGHADA
jgi:hypothetical protein